jgi:membrane protein implicated in regulation of membrane protease activity
MQLLWWHWMVLGFVLVVAELAIPSFFLIWFGVGALIVGIVLVALPGLPFAWQILVWLACSVAFVVLWFKIFRPGFHKTRSGTAKGAAIGEVGLVTRDIRPQVTGQVRFQKPLLGADLWDSMADEEIRVGERVRVLDVEGNTLKVGKA